MYCPATWPCWERLEEIDGLILKIGERFGYTGQVTRFWNLLKRGTILSPLDSTELNIVLLGLYNYEEGCDIIDTRW